MSHLRTWVVSLFGQFRGFEKEYKDNFELRDTSPLSEEILVETFLPKFKLSSLDKYDGTTNLRNHLVVLKTTIQLQNVNDFVLC